MTKLDADNNLRELYFEFQDRVLKVACQVPPQDLDAAKEVLDKTFQDMEMEYELRWKSSPSALGTSTWLLMGAINLAHRVVCLEREATLQTRDLEEKLSKLLDDVPDDAIPNDTTSDFSRLPPME
ncbi:MAG: cell division protein ZapA [Holophagales bacterium]|nr:cell division protein ZapA [Holophagales bacterium]